MAPSSAVFFPDDLIGIVFSVLPVKSLLRFRCVNKSCDILISDPTFVKLHLKRSAARNALLTINTQHIEETFGVRDCGCCHPMELKWEVDYCLVQYPIGRLIENLPFTLVVDPYYQWKDKSWFRIVGFCNGLVCLAGNSFEVGPWNHYWWLRLWNPATRKISEKFGYFCDFFNLSIHEYSGFSFGFDNSTDTYKVAAFNYKSDQLTSEVRILSVGDNVWRNIESFPVVPLRLGYEENDVYLSGTLNWLAIHNAFLYNYKDITIEQFVIVSLDLKTETYNQYQLPSGFDEVPPKEPTIGVLGGCLCFSYSYKETDFVIWQMNKFGVLDSWTQFFRISYQNLLIDYDFSDDMTKFRLQLVPLLLSEDGDTLILKSSQDFQAILYNLRDNRVERTKISASRTLTGNRTSDYVSWNFFKASVESLVPPVF